MFTHVFVGSKDLASSASFYDAVFGVFGVEGREFGRFRIYLKDGLSFGFGLPLDSKEATHANGGTIGFSAANAHQVDALYSAGLKAGGSCEGEPGPRPNAPGKAYGAYLRDPSGNKICFFTQLP